MKYFFYFIFFLKTDIRINPEIILGKDFNDFGLAIGIGDDTDVGTYTYFKTEIYYKFEFEINNIKLINKLGCYVEIGKRQSIGLKYKTYYKLFAQISFLVRKEKNKLHFQIEFGMAKTYKDYFCEISLGFHRSEINKVKNKNEYISKIKTLGKKQLKKQILHKFIWNQNEFLDGCKIIITNYINNNDIITSTKDSEEINFKKFLDQYVKTFDPLFQEISSRKLNRILDDIFIEQKKLFKEIYYNDHNVCTKLNKYSARFLTQDILDFDYKEEYEEENISSKNNYFSYHGIQSNIINRAIKYQKYSDNIFLLKPTTEINEIYKKYLEKILLPKLIPPSEGKMIGHVFMQQSEGNKVDFVDVQVPMSNGFFNINESEIPIAYDSNCALYSYFLSVFTLISGDLKKGKKILLTFYQNFDEKNEEKTKSQIIEFIKDPVESKNKLKNFLNNLQLYISYSEEKNKSFVQILKDIFLKENL